MAKMNGTRVSNLVLGQSVEMAGNPVTIQRSTQKDKRTYTVSYIDVYGDENTADFDCNHKFKNLDDHTYLAFLREIHKMTRDILT